jgi:hypothetical protein
MNLQELLDELRENMLYDRGTSTGADDKLWSDATLVRYINEAHKRFARQTFVIRDATTAEVINVTLESGTDTYTLHDSILSVVSARISDRQADLVRVGHSILGSYRNPSTMVWDSNCMSWQPGAPLAYSTDEQVVYDDEGTTSTVSMRIFPVPDDAADGTLIKLRVVRRPLDELTINNLSAVPEVPSDHHIEMLDYAAYLALRIADVDAGNPARAEAYRQSFESHVAEAKNLVMRKLFSPQPWGFGQGGWSWGA